MTANETEDTLKEKETQPPYDGCDCPTCEAAQPAPDAPQYVDWERVPRSTWPNAPAPDAIDKALHELEGFAIELEARREYTAGAAIRAKAATARAKLAEERAERASDRAKLADYVVTLERVQKSLEAVLADRAELRKALEAADRLADAVALHGISQLPGDARAEEVAIAVYRAARKEAQA